MPIPDTITDSVAITNVKTSAEQVPFYQSLANANAVAHQQGMQTILTGIVGALGNKIANLDAAEAASVNKVATGNDVASMITALMSALNSGQQGVKSAQTTPPTTP